MSHLLSAAPVQYLHRPNTVEVLAMRQRIYRVFGSIHVEPKLMDIMLQRSFPMQRLFYAKPVSAINHFI